MTGDIPVSELQLGKYNNILMVEDNLGDVGLVREALGESESQNRLYVVDDGEKAMAFVRHQGLYGDVPRPDLILLDLNLPRKNGREVLAEIKADDDLKRIPVVILTTSRAEDDIIKAYNLHANCYITKPIDLDQFLHIISTIREFWLSIVFLPPNRESI
jgi:two-component system, chemotaxis family, response regulator Rcp1